MECDYIIVGQGIAGTLVAHFLLQQNKKLTIIDANHQGSSSTVAAGLVNPITGRRFVKSWKIDTLIPFAKKTYQSLEKKFDISIFNQREVAMLFAATKVENDWLARSADEDIQAYVTKGFEKSFYSGFVKGVEAGVEFKQAARVNMKNLLFAYKQKLQEEQNYIEASFDFNQLKIEEDGVVYQGVKASNIIFAEGYQGMQNPYFNYLPFNPAKGEILICKIPNYPANKKLIKHGVFIVHLEDDLYWIGSSYLRDYKHENTTEEEKQNLINRLQSVLKLPFEVVGHEAAVRPTVRDRRPFIGEHPLYKNMYIFNGMGAKGSYLAPYFANHFVEYLENNLALDKEVNIERYQKYYGRT